LTKKTILLVLFVASYQSHKKYVDKRFANFGQNSLCCLCFAWGGFNADFGARVPVPLRGACSNGTTRATAKLDSDCDWEAA
jgi:hypothetical protein